MNQTCDRCGPAVRAVYRIHREGEPGSTEVTADQGQPAVQADPAAVEAGDGGTLAGRLTPGRPAAPCLPQRPARVHQTRQRATEPPGTSARIVTQQPAGGRGRRWRPRPRGQRGCPSSGVEQRAESSNSRHPVRHGTVDPQEHPDPPTGQPGQKPRLPGRPRPVQAASAQLLTRRQKLRLARRGGEREEVPRLCRYRRPAGHRGQAHATASRAKQPRSGRVRRRAPARWLTGPAAGSTKAARVRAWAKISTPVTRTRRHCLAHGGAIVRACSRGRAAGCAGRRCRYPARFRSAATRRSRR